MRQPKLQAHPVAHALALALAAGLGTAAQAVEVTVTVENLSPENGLFVTPIWVGFHNGGFDVYNLGDPASAGLERLAEDGVTGTISGEFATAEPNGQDATLEVEANSSPKAIEMIQGLSGGDAVEFLRYKMFESEEEMRSYVRERFPHPELLDVATAGFVWRD